jgi:hypothetical protein
MPDASHEALRDLVQVREAAKKEQLRARHRLGKLLLRYGRPLRAKIAETILLVGFSEQGEKKDQRET